MDLSQTPLSVELESLEQVDVLDPLFKIGSEIDRPVDVLPGERVVSHEAGDVVVRQPGLDPETPGSENTLQAVSGIVLRSDSKKIHFVKKEEKTAKMATNLNILGNYLGARVTPNQFGHRLALRST